MPSLRSLSRPTLALAVLAALAAPGCKKTPDAGTDGPGAAAGPNAQSGTVLRYKTAPVKLKETVTVAVTTTGQGGSGEMKADVTGMLDVSDAGGGKLKVGYSVLEVRAFELLGQMAPKPKEGKPLPDLKAQLLAGKGAKIVDLRGDEDDKASEALPENKKPPQEQGKEPELDAGEFASFLGLPPELPEGGLVEGTPVKVKKEKADKLGPIEIDMEIDLTYTLVKIDASSGKRLAEIKIEAEASGAKELSQGGQNIMISLDRTTESTLVFNLDDQLPVRSHLESTLAGNFGQFGSSETRFVVDANYEPAT